MYAATAAPGLTFWDAGELIAAVDALGVPHPPGTPLFILLARAWSDALFFLPRALATNLLSAACTAAAGALLAALLSRATGHRWAAFAAAACAGSASTVWLSATETEVYSASLLLAAGMLWTAWRAGETGDGRWVALTAYLFALAIPLHVSALVAAPAAVALAASARPRAARWRNGLLLGAAFLAAATIGTGSTLAPGAMLLLIAAATIAGRAGRARTAALTVSAIVVATSALLFVVIRGPFDPGINTGNVSGWSGLWELVGRRQYGAIGPWPRQAPLWMQLGNLVEYMDWQFALGLAPGVAPSWVRTPVTLAFVALGVHGCLEHRRREARSWRGFAVLFACASVCLVLYLNFKAGASYGWPFVPDAAAHEARERDYFFALAFWTWGLWAGLGAVWLAERFGAAMRPLGVAMAALPIALNWRAVDRRREPEASLPRTVARAILSSTPERAVLVTAGDNDSFPLWYVQTVEGLRPDVTVVVSPLLGAGWYRDQIARRNALLEPADIVAWPGSGAGLALIRDRTRSSGRPFVLAFTAARLRSALSGSWVLRGFTLAPASDVAAELVAWPLQLGVGVDTAATAAFVRQFGFVAPPRVAASIDPTASAMAGLLVCPARALDATRDPVVTDSLDSICNLR